MAYGPPAEFRITLKLQEIRAAFAQVVIRSLMENCLRQGEWDGAARHPDAVVASTTWAKAARISCNFSVIRNAAGGP